MMDWIIIIMLLISYLSVQQQGEVCTHTIGILKVWPTIQLQ